MPGLFGAGGAAGCSESTGICGGDDRNFGFASRFCVETGSIAGPVGIDDSVSGNFNGAGLPDGSEPA